MDYIDLQRVSDLSSDAIKSVRVLLDYVQGRDLNLYRHVYMCWDKLCNVQSSADKVLKSRPKCPDPHNCKRWIEALSDVCQGCKFQR